MTGYTPARLRRATSEDFDVLTSIVSRTKITRAELAALVPQLLGGPARSRT
jgi:hypothetical protein